MNRSVEYEAKALHFAEIGMYEAAQVFATLALVEAARAGGNNKCLDCPPALDNFAITSPTTYGVS